MSDKDKSPSSTHAFSLADQIPSLGDTKKLPPIHLWDPPFSGDIDMEIRRNGDWFYQGSRITRPALVKLFSTVMRREDDGAYYLVTPVEKVRIRVEDAPLHVIALGVVVQDGIQHLQFTTLTDDVVVADAEHPITIVDGEEGPVPYLHVRDRLDALISRSVYYELVAMGHEVVENNQRALAVTSAGVEFKLGDY